MVASGVPYKLYKAEALVVLHEILAECKESIVLTCVSLDSPYAHVLADARGYRIRMKCVLDTFSRGCLSPILGRHGLSLEEQGGYVTLFKS
jgi:hypothetical protein